MSGHIVVSVILCALHCQPTDLRIWDGDTFRVLPIRMSTIPLAVGPGGSSI